MVGLKSSFVAAALLFASMKSAGAEPSSVSDLTVRIKQHPGNALYYNMRGLEYLGQKKFEQALSDFDTAMRLYPKPDAAIIGNRALAYSGKGQYARAIDEFGKAIKLDPRNAWIHYQRAMTLRAKGDYRRAIADFGTALELSPRYVLAYCDRADAFLRVGDRTNARADLSKALSLAPQLRANPAFVKASQEAESPPVGAAPPAPTADRTVDPDVRQAPAASK